MRSVGELQGRCFVRVASDIEIGGSNLERRGLELGLNVWRLAEEAGKQEDKGSGALVWAAQPECALKGGAER